MQHTPAPKINIKRARLEAEILRLWDAQNPIAAIARSLGCGDNTVRRLLDDKRPGERLARSAKKTVTEKECQGCHEVKPLADFPPRADRPGVLHARCHLCLRDWRRTYQHDNPGRNREGVRRRRARLRAARTEPYRDLEIHARDGGLCWFCGLEVDLSEAWPSRMSMVVHHVHPIAKNGPDIRKNVGIAHYDCNHKAKDRYDPPFSEWVVSAVPYETAKEHIEANHYLHRIGLVSFAFGLYDENNVLAGVVTFGSPPSNRITKSVTEGSEKVLSLSRLWISDDAPFGVGSFFLARALRQLPAAIIVSYADTAITDPRYGTAHSGALYRACSFFYSGTSRPAVEWRLPGGERNVGRDTPGSVPVKVSPKARYWTVTGSQRERRRLRRACLWPVLPYLEPAAVLDAIKTRAIDQEAS